jgi:hypothetical protein
LAWATQNVYAQADIKLTKGSEVTLNDEDSKAAIGDDLLVDEFDVGTNPTAEERKLMAINQSAGAIALYFVKGLSARSTGEAFRASHNVGFTGVIVGNTGSSQTVAHELGHVLLDAGVHVQGGTNRNLMHPSIGDEKTELTDEQTKTMRASPFAR